MWYQTNFFKYATGTILILLIVLLVYQVAPLFTPVLNFITAILLPIMLASLFYYILRPLVQLVERGRIPRSIAIFMIYFIFLGIFITLNTIFVPEIIRQIDDLRTLPTTEKIEAVKEGTKDILRTLTFNQLSMTQIQHWLTIYWQKISEIITHFLLSSLSTLTSVAIALVLTPFVLFYFLKDDYLFVDFFMAYSPKEYEKEIRKIISDIDTTLSHYIHAQLTVALIVGSILYIGYLIINLQHALILALFAMIFYTIPFLGTFIAIIPALIIGLADSPFMAFKVILVMIVAHVIESDIVSPKILGQRLHIHPLTIILLLLAAGSLYGLIGLLLATPIYAIIKVIVWNVYKIFRLRYIIKTQEEKAEEQTVQPSGEEI